MTDLLDRAREWIAGDPDPATRAELQALVDANDEAELAERMAGSLEFGTAGLRGAVEAGSNRMNRAVVIRTTRGLADYLLERYDGSPPGPVVIGRDARLSSPQFMEDAIGVLAAAGLEVRYWEGDTPTPIVAFAALEFDAIAAIVVTASHNPPQDNGYKVYDRNGAQIVPPVDRQIAALIDAAPAAADTPRDPESERASPVGRETYDRYLAAIAALRAGSPQRGALRIVYTPMHGVGWQAVRASLYDAGYTDLHPVAEQVEPDGTFPTVAFPNPEEPGALDLATALADRIDADIIMANDPDADRLAVSVPTAAGWRQLTGNQIGVLLADHLLSHHSGGPPLVINSIVSSPMLRDVAAVHGARFETTLTGFKWIANAAMDIEADGVTEFVFGYEEALGYTVGPLVRDKDGVSAVLAFADLAQLCHDAGTSIADRLSEIYVRDGFWVSHQRSVVRPGSPGKAEIDAAMAQLSTDQPAALGGRAVLDVTDFRTGAEDRPRWLPEAALVVFELEGDARVLVRPSGTEPKLKLYVDARADVPEGCDPFDLEPRLGQLAEAAISDLLAFLGLNQGET